MSGLAQSKVKSYLSRRMHSCSVWPAAFAEQHGSCSHTVAFFCMSQVIAGICAPFITKSRQMHASVRDQLLSIEFVSLECRLAQPRFPIS